MKIPGPKDLNPIETAVWAAEFVRVRAGGIRGSGSAGATDVEAAVKEANYAVDDLRRARGRQ